MERKSGARHMAGKEYIPVSTGTEDENKDT